MKIKLTGASGYLGSLITQILIENGYEVSAIPRKKLYGSADELKDEIAEADILINLAGAPILQRWNKKNKLLIYESRIKTTKNLVKAIQLLPREKQPVKFISASAIGIYKSGEIHLEESKTFDSGFVGKVVKDWESALDDLPENVQKIIFRIGLVLGKNAKTITKLLLPFKLGLGGTIGNGNQAFPFIHEKDLTAAFLWSIKKYNKNGVFNLTAPQNITNREFTKTFAKVLKRPVFLPVPQFILKLVFGKAAVLLTQSPEVISRNLQKENFKFKYPNIEMALKEIVGS